MSHIEPSAAVNCMVCYIRSSLEPMELFGAPTTVLLRLA